MTPPDHRGSVQRSVNLTVASGTVASASPASASPASRSTRASRPALSLVPPAQQRTRYSPLALWHLLSLDAPSVATLWTFAIARSVGLHLP